MKHLLFFLFLLLLDATGCAMADVCIVGGYNATTGTLSKTTEIYALDSSGNVAPITYTLKLALVVPSYKVNGVTVPSLTIPAGTKLSSTAILYFNGQPYYTDKTAADALFSTAVSQSK